MKSRARIFFGRLAVVASVLGISMLGDLRLQASESSSPVRHASAAESVAVDVLRPMTASVGSTFGSDADDVVAGDDASDDDDGRLVPAIYAWDPDVRFIYYRHVSKWM